MPVVVADDCVEKAAKEEEEENEEDAGTQLEPERNDKRVCCGTGQGEEIGHVKGAAGDVDRVGGWKGMGCVSEMLGCADWSMSGGDNDWPVACWPPAGGGVAEKGCERRDAVGRPRNRLGADSLCCIV